MKEFLEILKLLRDTPIPIILVGGGIVFLFIAVGGQFGAAINTDKVRIKEKSATVIGLFLLIAGIALYIVPIIYSSTSEDVIDDDAVFEATPSEQSASVNTPTPRPKSTPTKTPRPTNTPRPTPSPTATIDADPTVYDNFNNPAYDGKKDHNLWESYMDNGTGQIFQENGILVLLRDSRSGGRVGNWSGIGLSTRKYGKLPIEKDIFYEAKLKVANSQTGVIYLAVDFFPTSGQYTSICNLGNGDEQANFHCIFIDSNREGLFQTQAKSVDFGIWYTARIEIDSATMEQTYYLDGQVLDSYIPINAEELKKTGIHFGIGVGSEFDEPVAGYIDNVRIGQPGNE